MKISFNNCVKCSKAWNNRSKPSTMITCPPNLHPKLPFFREQIPITTLIKSHHPHHLLSNPHKPPNIRLQSLDDSNPVDCIFRPDSFSS
jgi:hypothetical protein